MASAPSASDRQPDLMALSVEEPIEIYVPGLTELSLFVTLPMTDGIAALLDKYLAPNQRPPRDLTGNYQDKKLNELIATHNWRAVAHYSRTTITNTSTDQTALILAHWTLRLHALLRLHLIQPFIAELSALFSLLPPPSSEPDAPLFHPAVPFELLVLRAGSPALRGAKEDAVEGLAELIRGAKSEHWTAKRAGDETDAALWKERVERMGGLVEGLLGEVKAGSAAMNLAEPAKPSPALLSGLCRQHYATGDQASLHAAHARLSSLVISDATDAWAARRTGALVKVANGEWAEAEKEWRALVEEDASDLEAINNLAVSLLYQARLNDALALLTKLVAEQPDRAANSEPVLFNLATLHELRTEQAVAAKVGTLKGVAERGGQGLRHGALKLAL